MATNIGQLSGFIIGILTSTVFYNYSIFFDTFSTQPKGTVFNHEKLKSSFITPILTTDDKKYSCNESFNMTRGRPAVFRTFQVEQCSNPGTDQSTTLILSHPVIEKLAFLEVIKTALTEFARVILVTHKSEIKKGETIESYTKWSRKKLFTVAVESHGCYGDAMNKALNLVTTPLVLVAPGLAIEGPKVKISIYLSMVGRLNYGFIRDPNKVLILNTGHWLKPQGSGYLP